MDWLGSRLPGTRTGAGPLAIASLCACWLAAPSFAAPARGYTPARAKAVLAHRGYRTTSIDCTRARTVVRCRWRAERAVPSAG